MKPTTETAIGIGGRDGDDLAGSPGESPRHSVLMLLHLVRWASGRLERIEAHLVYEHEPGHSMSNDSHREDVLRLVRDYQRGIRLLQAGCCKEPTFVALLVKATQVEIAVGSKLYQADIIKEVNPVDGLVERLKPIVRGAYEEVETLLREVEQFRATYFA